MKNLLIVFMLMLSSIAMADTSDSKHYWFDGSSDQAHLRLSTEKTRTEYRTVRVPATCYRTTHRRQCHQQPRQCRQVCRQGRNGQRVCRQQCSPARQVCRNVPVRTPYRCYRMEQRPYEVHDYYVDTNARLNFNMDQVSNTPAEDFKVKVNGENSRLKVKSSKNYAILLTNTDKHAVRNGGVKTIDVDYDLKLVPAKIINNTLSHNGADATLVNGVLTFELGRDFNARDFTQHLKVYRTRIMATDKKLFDRQLNQADMQINTNGNAAQVSINLNSLGIKVPSKVKVILDTSYNLRGAAVLNSSDIQVKASRTYKFKN